MSCLEASICEYIRLIFWNNIEIKVVKNSHTLTCRRFRNKSFKSDEKCDGNRTWQWTILIKRPVLNLQQMLDEIFKIRRNVIRKINLKQFTHLNLLHWSKFNSSISFNLAYPSRHNFFIDLNRLVCKEWRISSSHFIHQHS